jgi:hypothetical protein
MYSTEQTRTDFMKHGFWCDPTATHVWPNLPSLSLYGRVLQIVLCRVISFSLRIRPSLVWMPGNENWFTVEKYVRTTLFLCFIIFPFKKRPLCDATVMIQNFYWVCTYIIGMITIICISIISKEYSVRKVLSRNSRFQ